MIIKIQSDISVNLENRLKYDIRAFHGEKNLFEIGKMTRLS